jgi:phage/plasmid-associated DNA primase
MAATEQYKAESDTFLLWFNEVLVVDPTSEVTAKRVYASYRAWCEEAGELAITQTQFGLRIGERILGKRVSNGTLYRGIRFQCSSSGRDVSADDP